MEGTTTFAVGGDDVKEFVFNINILGDTLRVYLEDQETKDQWLSAALVVDDFVDEASRVPQATVDDYAACIVHVLEAETATGRQLEYTQKGETRTSTLKLKCVLRVAPFRAVLIYKFPLNLIHQPDPATLIDSLVAENRRLKRLSRIHTGSGPGSHDGIDVDALDLETMAVPDSHRGVKRERPHTHSPAPRRMRRDRSTL